MASIWFQNPFKSFGQTVATVPTTFTAWGGYSDLNFEILRTTSAPTCVLNDVTDPMHPSKVADGQITADACSVFMNLIFLLESGTPADPSLQWRAAFSNITPVAGKKYQLLATYGGTTSTIDINFDNAVANLIPTCPISLPSTGTDGDPFPVPAPITSAPAGSALHAAVGAGFATRSAVAIPALSLGLPIAFDFPWNPAIVHCIAAVFRISTLATLTVTRGELTIGRAGVLVPLPVGAGSGTPSFLARILLLDRAGNVLLSRDYPL